MQPKIAFAHGNGERLSPLLREPQEDFMAIDHPHRSTSSGAIYVVAMILLVAVLALAAVTLWQTDNSGTNSLSGDPQAITPPATTSAP
jgi:hypothetical protein